MEWQNHSTGCSLPLIIITILIMMSASISHLPYDIVHSIASYLNIKDYQSFSWASKKFRKDLQHEGTVKKCLRASLPFSRASVKAFQSSQSDQAWKHFNVRNAQSHALRTASPYSVTLLAQASSFVYDDGVICYITRRTPQTATELRILDLSQSAPQTEKVISSSFFHQRIADIPEWMTMLAMNKATTTTPSDSPSMAVLGFNVSVATVVVYNAGPYNESYLFAVDISDHTAQRILVCIPLRSTHRLFARHDEEFLYYGTHTASGSLDFREWTIQGYDLRTGSALTDEPIQLCGFPGSDLHSVVDFKIFEKHFYAISNQTAFENQEINWTSYYCYVRFKASSGGQEEGDLLLNTIWRRQDTEGPINDMYTHMSLEIDETTGQLMLVEVRKEWKDNSSTSHRTCYMQPFNQSEHGRPNSRHRVTAEEQLDLTIETTDPQDIPLRLAKYTHHEFGKAFTGERHEYTPTKTKWKTYSYSNSAFVELVVDDLAVQNSWKHKERIGLRIASRAAISTPVGVSEGGGREHHCFEDLNIHDYSDNYHDTRKEGVEEDVEEDVNEDVDETFPSSQIFKWPPQGLSICEELEETMCPRGKAGNNVQAALGDEGIVYLVGAGSDQCAQRSLIYLSFDPTFGFDGMRRVDGSLVRPRGMHQEQQNICSIRHHRKRSMSPHKSISPRPTTKRQKSSDQGSMVSPVMSESSLPNSDGRHNKVEPQHQRKQESKPVYQSTRYSNRHLYREFAMYSQLKRSWWLR